MRDVMTDSRKEVICVDDQAQVRDLLEDIFRERGKKVYSFSEGEDAIAHLKARVKDVALVVLDLDLGPKQPNGMFFLKEIRASFPEVPTVILTGKGTVETAVEAVKLGALDFIEKDFYLEDKLEVSVEKIERLHQLSKERDRLKDANTQLKQHIDELIADKEESRSIIGSSNKLSAILDRAKRVAVLPRPVLIYGERGTGKELIAHAVHQHSDRKDGPFIVMNCGAVPDTLLESELFGHERGAFTGATSKKAGKFELANGGTLFLDEIGNMSLDFQMKILRVIEYQRFTRVAGQQELEVDVRVIAATNVNLLDEIEEGRFRADLYDRLTFEILELPPLRDRKEDIAELVEYFAKRFSMEVSSRPKRFSKEALAGLSAYDFPGNIRELKNIVERAMYLSDKAEINGETIDAALPRRRESAHVEDDASLSFIDRVDHYQQSLLLHALNVHKWSQKDAASDLGLTYDQFRHLYRKYNLIDRKDEN